MWRTVPQSAIGKMAVHEERLAYKQFSSETGCITMLKDEQKSAQKAILRLEIVFCFTCKQIWEVRGGQSLAPGWSF